MPSLGEVEWAREAVHSEMHRGVILNLLRCGPKCTRSAHAFHWSHPMIERGCILGHFLHEIPRGIVVGSSYDCTNELVLDEQGSSILLDTVLDQRNMHRECGRASDTLISLLIKHPLYRPRMTHRCQSYLGRSESFRGKGVIWTARHKIIPATQPTAKRPEGWQCRARYNPPSNTLRKGHTRSA